MSTGSRNVVALGSLLVAVAGLPQGVDNGAMPPGTVVAVALDEEQVRPDGTVHCSD